MAISEVTDLYYEARQYPEDSRRPEKVLYNSGKETTELKQKL